MASAAATVFHSQALLVTVCSYQDGVYKAIQSLLGYPIICGIYGRMTTNEETREDEPPVMTGGTEFRIDIDIDVLPAIMELRRQAMTAVLCNPRAAADLTSLLKTHFHLRNVVAEYAAFYGDMKLTKLICENAKERLPWRQHKSRQSTETKACTLLQLAAYHGHVEIMKIFAASNEHCWRRGALTRYSDLEVAAERGHIACVQYALEYANSNDTSYSYWGLRNEVPVLRRGVLMFKSCHHLNVLDLVAGEGKLEIARLLLDHGAPYSEAAIDNAASNGHLAMVQCIHAKPESKCTTQAMDGAAANGHLEVVQFLHDHRNEGYTKDAMEEAARNGHDAVVRFLLSKNRAGGSTKTMNEYVARGDLAMVKLLAMGKCSSGSVNVAASHGHLGLVKYLVGHKEVAFSAPAVEAAVKNGHLDVVEYFLNQRPNICTTKLVQVAKAAKQTAVMAYFESHQCECCKDVPRDKLTVAAKIPLKKRRRKN
ncbi:Aste57867_27 [Aphanomyces stellatus]|uniref:Aste57867_27 protein n=1 Tax=Aphanomyces stellatus TaxID=120398 RepID=A0A485K5P2_9STRA|nr:hypothetical protein As57867_000027 [Aphanomyces stellatus]VFT77253.1 Aste57867_27 [Aphanomyces stellatus]